MKVQLLWLKDRRKVRPRAPHVPHAYSEHRVKTMSRKTGNRMELWRENRSVREACSGQRLVNLLVTLRYKINTQLSMSKRRQWKWELRGEPEAKTISWKHCWHPSERHYCQKKCTKRRQMGKDQVLGNAAIQVAGSRKGTESRTGRE